MLSVRRHYTHEPYNNSLMDYDFGTRLNAWMLMGALWTNVRLAISDQQDRLFGLHE